MNNDGNKLFSGEYFGYHINMKGYLITRYRNLFILIATFFVLCLSPLADIHFEVNSHEKVYVHGQDHSETSFPLFIHELLFSHLQHTFDHVTLGISHQTLKKGQNILSEKTVSSFHSKAVSNSRLQSNTAYLQKDNAVLLDPIWTTGIVSQEYSGLSPPIFSC
jgi:malate/lactate dehydrogenase